MVKEIAFIGDGRLRVKVVGEVVKKERESRMPEERESAMTL